MLKFKKVETFMSLKVSTFSLMDYVLFTKEANSQYNKPKKAID